MGRWRLAVVTALLLLAFPMLFPWLDLVRFPVAWSAWTETDRLTTVLMQSGLLVVGTVALALPSGVLLAVLLYRTELPGRRFLRFVVLWLVLIPLPLFATGWEIPLNWFEIVPGLPRAIWIHAVAGLPWVVLIVGQGVCWVERAVEEDALLVVPPWRVVCAVTLPRASGSIGAAAVWVALQTLTEITVADRMLVRTFAEEVYLQLSRVEGTQFLQEVDELVAYALAIAAPAVPVMGLVFGWALWRWQRSVPALVRRAPVVLFSLGSVRGWVTLGVFSGVACLTVVPIGALIWRAGLTGVPATWSLSALVEELRLILVTRGTTILGSLALALSVGLFTTTLAWFALWAARACRWLQVGLFVLVVAAWTIPGPILGLGMKQAIFWLLELPHPRWLGDVLYYRPSPVPVFWVQSLRLFPFAVALLWPVMRMIPRELFDVARVDGATPLRELQYLVAPLTYRAFGRSVLALAALALGELSASKLASIPGAQTYAEKLFIAMHAGLGNDLAAQSLLLLAVTLVPAFVLATREWQGTNAPTQAEVE